MPLASAPSADRYDVVVIGGAFAGASSALLLRRLVPAARVLVVENRAAFDFKVGEATVEVSARFLTRVLGLYGWMNRHQLPKHGLRYWFTDRPDRTLAEMSEVGPRQGPALPTFQLDRARLDEGLLGLACEAGAEVLRPARVSDIDGDGEGARLLIETGRAASEAAPGGGTSAWPIRARWVVDASGRHAFLARRWRLLERVEAHPTAAWWARWEGIADMDGPAVLGPDPARTRLPDLPVARRLATNHFCGYGYWCWVIPLVGGQTSIGLVYNKELYEPPGKGALCDRYRAFLASHAGLRELTAGARMDEEDFRVYGHLPYRSRQYMGKRWALVGDAAAFIDPYYSPGLDHASISVFATARLLAADLAGDLAGAALDAAVAEHNARFARSYDRWLAAIYLGKYELMGDAQLIRCSYLLDTALYYLGIVNPVYRRLESMANPVLGLPLRRATVAFWLLRAINRRLLHHARQRRRLGLYGRRNAGWHAYSRSFGLGLGTLPHLLTGLGELARLEGELVVARLARLLRLRRAAPAGKSALPGPRPDSSSPPDIPAMPPLPGEEGATTGRPSPVP